MPWKNDPQTAWKIINELKNDSLPADKAEKINCNQWFTHFRDLLHSNTNKIDNDRQNTKVNFFNMKTPFKVVL